MRWLLGITLLVLAAPARHAAACSHPSQPGAPYLAFPRPGATDVPTNAVFTIHQATYVDQLTGQLNLRDPAGVLHGTSVVFVGGWGTGDLGNASWRATPLSPLAAATTYELLIVDGDVVQPLGSVTTADGPDETPPSTPLLAGVHLSTAHDCASPLQCCFPTGLLTVDAEIRVAAAAEPVAYSLREASRVVAVDMLGSPVGLLGCGTQVPTFRETSSAERPPAFLLQGAAHELTLVARDLAGNESPPVAVSIAADCSRVEEPPPPSADDDGCGCRSGGAAGRAWPALLVVLLLRRRR
jgi:MYXO-CTERM domain-containing protein